LQLILNTVFWTQLTSFIQGKTVDFHQALSKFPQTSPSRKT
jgi:hypothetical protein